MKLQNKKLNKIRNYYRALLVRWSLHKYKCLWGVMGGGGEESGFKFLGESFTYIYTQTRLEQNFYFVSKNQIRNCYSIQLERLTCMVVWACYILVTRLRITIHLDTSQMKLVFVRGSSIYIYIYIYNHPGKYLSPQNKI